MGSFTIKGDFAKLEGWSNRLERLESVKRIIVTNMGEELLELVREGFEKESAPDGSHWTPLKRRVGKILQDTGRMRNSFHRKALSSTSVTIGPAVSYAGFHQTGTSRMVARKMVPDGKLPPGWKSRLQKIAKAALKSAIGG